MKRPLFIIILLAGFAVFRFFFSGSGPEIRNPNSTNTTIICFGDSLTYGTGATKGKEYPSVLAELIDRPVINAGKPGQCSCRTF